ncbi:MAG TPA: SHOCT domain-containing protein, partial [Microbacterium sp.]|nr:SHOCT domain-containing protein [Microbacterium sp.]
AAGGTDVVAQLQQLATLKAQGVLSEGEFEAAKAKLLG